MKSFCLELRGFKTLNRTGRATTLIQKGKKTSCNRDKAYLALGCTQMFVAEWGIQNTSALSCINSWTIAIRLSRNVRGFVVWAVASLGAGAGGWAEETDAWDSRSSSSVECLLMTEQGEA